MKNQYDERYLAGRISEPEFNAVIDELSKIVARTYSVKKILDKQGVPSLVVWVLVGCLIASGCYLLVAYAGIEKDNLLLNIIGIVLLIPILVVPNCVLFH